MPAQERTCCGVVQDAKVEARKRKANKPQPWAVRKFAVVLTLSIAGYAAYVYIGRVCRAMIVRDSDAMGSLPVGVLFLVIYMIVLLLMLWSYTKVVITSPGLARNFTNKTERLGYDSPRDDHQSGASTELRGFPYDKTVSHANTTDPSPHRSPSTCDLVKPPSLTSQKREFQSSVSSRASERAPSRDAGGLGAGGSAHDTPHHRRQGSQNTTRTTASPTSTSFVIKPPEEARVKDVVTKRDAPDSTFLPRGINGNAMSQGKEYSSHMSNYGYGDNGSSQRANLKALARRPQMTPILLPEYRYCGRCKIVKPHRTHHCRACGTCVLKYDHHCPWIGQCVGAFNQKFFVNFLLWGTVYCWWTFGSLLGLFIVHQTVPFANFDPQVPIVIGIAGLFGLFAFLMLITQIHLIVQNQTTVESMTARTMKDRETGVLGDAFQWWECG
ncbi:hypothetical protein ID866_9257 [Astraeus odoratus]|nr:hypothetical protein ID866_9257 [Astraeus odoratus]